MLRATGIDIGATGTRRVSVGQFWGGVSREKSTPLNGPLIANVGAAKLTFRRINVPHAGRDIQGQVVREELAFSLPFSLDTAAWDWIENDEMASVVVAFNEEILKLRANVGTHATIDTEPFSLLRALREARQTEALVFDFGATHTTVCGIKDRALEWIKVSLRGGQDLTQRLAEKHDFNIDDAEMHKCSVGCEDPICAQWLGDLVASLALDTRPAFTNVYVCGGGSAMPGLLEKLSELCGQPAKLFPLPNKLSAYTDVIAYGAALAGKPRRPKVQLCPADPKSSDIKVIYAVWLLILLIMGTCDLELRYANAARLQSQHLAVITKAIQEQAPELKELKPEALATEVEKRLEKAQRISLSSSDNCLATLAALDKKMVPITNMELRSIEFKPDNSGQHTLVELSGLAESSQQVEEFRSACDKVLTKAELVDNRAGGDNTTRFSIEGQLRQQ